MSTRKASVDVGDDVEQLNISSMLSPTRRRPSELLMEAEYAADEHGDGNAVPQGLGSSVIHRPLQGKVRPSPRTLHLREVGMHEPTARTERSTREEEGPLPQPSPEGAVPALVAMLS